MGFEYEATSLQMMAAGTGSSAMLSDTDIGSMQHYEKIFSKVRYVEDSSQSKKVKRAPVQNPEESAAKV